MAMYIRQVPCDICDILEDVNSFCLNCKQKFCDNCKKGNLRTASTKHHKFAPIGDSLLPSSQKNEICNKHKDEIQFFCKTCDKLACSICLTEFHQKHEFSFVIQLLESAVNEINDKLEAKERQIDARNDDIENHKEAVEKCRTYSTESSAYIKKTIKGWIDELKSYENKHLQTTQKTAEKEIEDIDKKAKKLESKKTTLRKEVLDVKVKIQTCSGASLLKQKSEFLFQINAIAVPNAKMIEPVLPAVRLCESSKDRVRHALENKDAEAGTTTGSQISQIPQFQERDSQIKLKALKPVLKSELSIIKRFSAGEPVCDIAPVSESKAWIGTANNVMLVNTHGTILLKHSHGNKGYGTSLTSTSSGDVLYVSSYSTINRIDQTGQLIKFIDLAPENIFCVRSCKLTTDVIVATEKSILRLQQDWAVKKFKYVAKTVSEMSDGRLVVINNKNEIVLLGADGAVTVLDSSLQCILGIFTTALYCDTHDYIVVGSPFGKELHVYQQTGGKFEILKKYNVDAMKGPAIYAISDHTPGRLWIGTHFDGVIIIGFYT